MIVEVMIEEKLRKFYNKRERIIKKEKGGGERKRKRCVIYCHKFSEKIDDVVSILINKYFNLIWIDIDITKIK